MSILLAQDNVSFKIMICDCQSTLLNKEKNREDVIKFRFVPTLGMLGATGDPKVFINFCSEIDRSKKTEESYLYSLFNHVIEQRIHDFENLKNIEKSEEQFVCNYMESTKNTRISFIDNDDNIYLLQYQSNIIKLPNYTLLLIPPIDYNDEPKLNALVNKNPYKGKEVKDAILSLINKYRIVFEESKFINDVVSICYKEKNNSIFYYQKISINNIEGIDLTQNNYHSFESIFTDYNSY